MIGHLKGTLIHQDLKSIILDVSGVGYKIHTNTAVLNNKTGEVLEFWTYLAVRENALDLYGFEKKEELDFFELLLTVSGIGPKSALGILSVATIETLKKAIATGDTSYLNKVSGIGKKTAEKIVIELRDKLHAHKGEGESSNLLRGESDVVEALKTLGYSQNEARDALKKVPNNIEGTNARIKEALKILGSN